MPAESVARIDLESFGKIRPREFSVDLKEVKDANGTTFRYLNVLDIATRISRFFLVPNKSSEIVAKEFTSMWCAWAGVPTFVIHDQGGEFSAIDPM